MFSCLRLYTPTHSTLLQSHVGGLEKVGDGQLDNPQLPSFLGSPVLNVIPVSLLEGEGTCP